MKRTYQYKLKLTSNQRQEIDRWLNMLRFQYNYLLGERFKWWEYNRSDLTIPQGEYCLRWCEIGSQELKNNPDWHSQSANLKQLKFDRPWYKKIYSQVLQDCVKRVKLAFDRYIKGDCHDNRSGKPRFKSKNRYRTFTFPQIKQDSLAGVSIHIDTIDRSRIALSRSLLLKILQFFRLRSPASFIPSRTTDEYSSQR
jgi:putative transposase